MALLLIVGGGAAGILLGRRALRGGVRRLR